MGGTEVDPVNKYPWMVALVSSLGEHFCGGTLVASRYVVTAAHCMFQNSELTILKSLEDFKVMRAEITSPLILFPHQVRVGEHQLSESGEGSLAEKTIDVKNFTNHEFFNYKETSSYDNDISILELAQELDLSTYTPACLAKSSDTTTWDGKTAQVYGKLLNKKE